MSKISSYQSFFLDAELSIIESKGGLPLIQIDNKYATAEVSIYGAQVLSYKSKLQNPDNEANDLLFVSEKSYFEKGKAIKGGIPICWPWFGTDAENPDRQMHGFARNMLWKLDKTISTRDGDTKVTLSLSDTDETYKLWPHKFKLVLTITVGETLDLSLKTENAGQSNFKITQALHTYFAVDDIENARVKSLKNICFFDKVTNVNDLVEHSDYLSVNQEVDRIYKDSPSKLVLYKGEPSQEIAIESRGSKTTVVWNPWVEISKQSADLADDSYRRFICIETANAADDFIIIKPNESHTIGVKYKVG